MKQPLFGGICMGTMDLHDFGVVDIIRKATYGGFAARHGNVGGRRLLGIKKPILTTGLGFVEWWR